MYTLCMYTSGAYMCGLSQGQLVTYPEDGKRIAAGEPLNLLVVESEIFWGAGSVKDSTN